ncbi:MAG: hypothetical protein GF405_00830 [Candidatus Eisenbacteria bacterium]|nr:hypothetical protein [Candidatus Eisenbacteria bacterium]
MRPRDAFKERLASLARREGAGKDPREEPPRDLDGLRGSSLQNGVLIVERSLDELASRAEAEALGRRLSEARSAERGRDDLHDEIRRLVRCPDEAIFVDTETTGLSGNMVFLLGTMRVSGGRVTLRQVFARDYREEPALLEEWLRLLAGSSMIVSFNGKSFDLPVLRDRFALHGLDPPEEPVHVDLLHHSRRRWRGVLPDCRLQTLEWRVCGRRRTGDIPGDEIPAAYHRFVRTGDSTDMLTVFHHNALDLVTLADIAAALTAPEDGPA